MILVYRYACHSHIQIFSLQPLNFTSQWQPKRPLIILDWYNLNSVIQSYRCITLHWDKQIIEYLMVIANLNKLKHAFCFAATTCVNCNVSHRQTSFLIYDGFLRKFYLKSSRWSRSTWPKGIDDHITKRFDIQKRLGKGAYGIVWKAVDRKTKDVVAVKKIFDAFRNQTDVQRTFREIMFLQSFKNHPNIVKLHSIHRYPRKFPTFFSLCSHNFV